MGNEVVNRRLNVYIDAAGAEEALTRLTKKEADLVKAIDKARASGKDFTKEMQRLGETRSQIANLEGVISGKMLPSVRQAEAAVSKLRRELRQLPSDSEAAARKLQEFRKAEATLKAVKDQAYGVGRALDDVKKDRGIKGRLESGFGSLVNGGAKAFAAIGGIIAVKNALSAAVDQALEAEKATARLRSTLDNLGRLDVFDRLSSSAEQLAENFGYLDNDDILGVFDQLITYGKLTETQINQLTPVIIDFAAKSQIGLSEAADVIIKALEGNGKALKTYGIDIKDAKDETEAFGIIMGKLKPKVDGAAKAFGDTTAGQIAKTRQEIENLKEDIGVKLLPVTKRFYETINDLIGGFQDLFSSKNLSGFEKLRLLISGGRNTELRDKLFKGLEEQKDKNIIDPLTGKDGYGRVFRPDRNGTIGTGNGETEEQKRKREEEERKREEEAKRRQKELDDLTKKYKEFAATVRNERLDAEFGEIFAAFRKINEEAEADLAKLREFRKKGLVSPADYAELTKGIETVLDAQREKLQEKYNLNPVKVQVEPVFDPNKATADLEAGAPNNPLATLTRQLGRLDREATAKLELDILRSSGARRLKLMQQQLDEERDQELANKELTESEKAIIEDEYRQKKLQLEMDFWMNMTSVILDFASQFADIVGNISQIRQNKEQEALDKEIADNEKRKESAKKLLDSKVISQKEYDRRIAKIEADQEKRQKEQALRQFERDKNAQTVQAVISGAQSALQTIAKFGPPLYPNVLGIAAMALTLAVTGTQIAAIRSAKPPKFEDGGFIPQGSSHRQGGISLIDNRTGANLGEIEGGEPIISKKAYARNKSLVDAMLNPAWKDAPMSTMNIPRVNSSMQRRYFADGGILPEAAESSEALLVAIKQLNSRLTEPIRTYVAYGDYEMKANKINGIRNAGVIR